MSVLYLIQDGAVIRRRSESLVVEDRDGKILLNLESRRVECVCMLASVQATTAAVVELLRRGVTLAILSASGQLLGMISPPLSGNGQLRTAQYRMERDPAFALARGREIIAAKIHNQRQVLTEHLYERDGEDPAVARVVDQLRSLEESAGRAESVGALRGVEGAAARAYWSVFGNMLRVDGLTFRGRTAHPATDPVNAALSFGYSLLTRRIAGLAEAVGFDPFVGFLHEMAPGRPSLALDLMEPFRAPVVDRMVVSRFNRRILKPEHFVTLEDGEVRFVPDALKIFFREWEQAHHKMDVKHRYREQVEAYRDLLLGRRQSLSPWRWSAR